MAAALLTGQLPGRQCVMAHDEVSESGSARALAGGAHEHGDGSGDSGTSHHQHDGDDASACMMLVTCGTVAVAKSAVALRSVQAIAHELTAFVASQHSNPAALTHTPPPRA